MENANKLTNLDKILLKLVFQVDQGSQQQKEVKQQIHIYSATIAKKKQQIDELHVKSSQLDDEINRMQRMSLHIMENFKVWKPTCLLLTQHGEHFEKQLLEQHASTIRDKQIYQDYLKQYRKILQQHQSQYSEFSHAKEYLKKKVAFEEIRHRVLNCTEQMQQKTQFLADLLEPSSFGSLNEWALEIATIKIDTDNTLRQITTLRKKKASVDQYERRENATQFRDPESFKEISELQSDLLHFSNLPNIVTPNEQEQRIHQQNEYQIITNTAQNTEQAQSQRHGTVGLKSTVSLKLSKLVRQQSQTETESGKHKNLQANNVLVTQSNSIQKESERNLESSGKQQPKNFQMALATKKPGQTQYCPFVSKDQEDSAQWLENNSIMSVNSDDITVRTMDASQSKACIHTDSLHKSQAQVVLKSRNGDPEETTNDTPWIFPRTPEHIEPGEKEFEMNSNLPHENIQSKSPSFCFLNMSTPKSTEFNLFGRTAFDLTNTPEQMADNLSANQLEFSSLFFKKTPEKDYSPNRTSEGQSSQKDIGMESPSNEQPFTFSFQSDRPSNNFANSKDEFSFGFSFGQDQRSSQPGLFKFF
ncbi:protein SIX6OS1-like isoform X2 [Scyliorhinus canicula]|uniref:protein SIX6OS1-like isoform X2 n=1 Tax=Scyliorhinus canicula TaxID=7830 RepID=UPI0018F411B6|nr:protein SIX6OS1-like isoform X2 [Scyliorhinus canicula]